MEKYAEYEDYSPQAQVIQWLWEILKNFDDNWKANFLFFATGI